MTDKVATMGEVISVGNTLYRMVTFQRASDPLIQLATKSVVSFLIVMVHIVTWH